MDQEEICREMETLMRQLSLEGQQYLVALARAARQVEHYADEGAGVSGAPGGVSSSSSAGTD